jgi:hypothetical protein
MRDRPLYDPFMVCNTMSIRIQTPFFHNLCVETYFGL